MLLRVRHRTLYLYTRRVDLGPHLLMLRPRDSHDLKTISFAVSTTPPSLLSWSQDVYGNAVARALPMWMADALSIDCEIRVDNSAWPVPQPHIATGASWYPFRYDDGEWISLGQLTAPQYADPDGQLRNWASNFIASYPTGTLALLCDLNNGVADAICYQSRDDPGTQTPLDTLNRGWGSCRDLAILMAEAARWLGFGARLVSGYVYLPDLDPELASGSAPPPSFAVATDTEAGMPASGATHAWVEIYLPGAGWLAFDPTRRQYGNSHLIPVAVGLGIAELPPVAGNFTGTPGDYIGMHVSVTVSAGMPHHDTMRGH